MREGYGRNQRGGLNRVSPSMDDAGVTRKPDMRIEKETMADRAEKEFRCANRSFATWQP